MAADLPRGFGPYELLEKLGRGGMGDVFLARPGPTLGHLPAPLVIKRMHPDLASAPEYLDRFRHEAEVATKIDAPHVAKVYDAGRVDDVFYFSMEFIRGWTLSKIVRQLSKSGGHLDLELVADMIGGAIDGLHALHTAVDGTGTPTGFVHRDVAPKNIMVGEDQRTVLIDLGLGKSNLQAWRTRTGAVMGTPGYMAPEQVLARDVDHRADLYAVGLVLYELLTLQPYIPRAPIPDRLRASVAPPFTAPSSSRHELPSGIDDVLRRALALDPTERFQSAMEMGDAVRSVLGRPTTEERLATVVAGELTAELAARTTAVGRLLSAASERAMDPPQLDDTVVFARVQPKSARTSVKAWAVGAALVAAVVALAATLGVDRSKRGADQRLAPAPVVRTAPVRAVGGRSKPIGAVAQPAPAPPPPPSVPRRSRSRVRASPVPVVESPPRAAPAGPSEVSIEALIQRAQRTTAQLPPGSEKADRVAELTAELLLTLATADLQRRDAVAKALTSALDAP